MTGQCEVVKLPWLWIAVGALIWALMIGATVAITLAVAR